MLRQTTRYVIAVIIIVFWVAMMFMFVKRELLVTNSEPRAPSQKPINTWMGIYYPQDTRVGYVNFRSNPDTRHGQPGSALNVVAELNVEILSFPAEIEIRGTAWSDYEKGLQVFECDFKSAEYETHIEGKVLDSNLHIDVDMGDEHFPLKFPIAKQLLLGHGSVFNAPHLELGEETSVQVFDPTSFSVKKAKIACTGREDISIAGETVSTYVTTTTISNITSKTWVTKDGDIVKAQLPLGIVLKKISPEEISETTTF